MKKKLIIAIIPLVLVVILLPMLVSWSDRANEVAATLEEQMGGSVIYSGEYDGTFWFSPSLTLYDITIETLTPFGEATITLPDLTIRYSYGALLFGGDALSSVTLALDQPEILIRKQRKGSKLAVLREQQQGKPQSIHAFLNQTFQIPVHITDGSVVMLKSRRQRETFQIPELILDARHTPGALEVRGTLPIRELDIRLEGSVGIEGDDGDTLPFSLSVMHDGSSLELTGQKRLIGNAVQAQGEFAANMTSLAFLPGLFPAFTADNRLPQHNNPFEGKGKFAYEAKVLSLTDVAIQDAEAQWNAALNMVSRMSLPLEMRSSVRLEGANLNAVIPIVSDTVHALKAYQRSQASESLTFTGDYHVPLFNEQASIEVGLEGRNLTLGQETIETVRLNALLERGRWNITRAAARLPYDVAAIMTGEVQELSGGFRLVGKTRIQGPSLRQFLSWMKIHAPHIPDDKLKEFNGDFGITFDRQEISLNGARLTIDGNQITGTGSLIWPKEATHDDEQPHIPTLDITAKSDNLNIDEYLVAHNLLPDPTEPEKMLMDGDKPQWLVNFPLILKLNASLEAGVFRSVPVESARLRMTVEPGKLNIKTISAVFDGMAMTGKYRMETGRLRPRVGLVLIGDQIDVSLFRQLITASTNPDDWNIIGDGTAHDMASDDGYEPVWSNMPLTTYLLELVDGSFAFEIKKLRLSDDLAFDNVTFKSTLSDRSMAITEMMAQGMGGDIALTGTIVGGSVPSFVFDILIEGIEIGELMALKTDVDTFSGPVKFSGTISSQGVSHLSMARNLDANMQVESDNLQAVGFEANAIARRVFTVRTVDDVKVVGEQALSGGRTRFREIRGNLIITDGQAQMHNALVKTEFTHGSFTMALDMPTLVVNSRYAFRPVSRTAADLPSVYLNIVGQLDNADAIIDLKELEAYTAKRAAQKSF